MREIKAKREDLRRGGFDLGAERSGVKELPDGGRSQAFEHGMIFWSRDAGAHEVHGPILEAYREEGGPQSPIGYPVTDHRSTPDGRAEYVRFQGGSLYLDRGFHELGVYLVPPQPVPCDLEPTQHGRWDVPVYGSGVTGVHTALLDGSKVLFFTYRVPPGCPSRPAEFGESAFLDLSTGYLSTPTYQGPPLKTHMENLFCAGHAFLRDGSLLVAGGEREDVDKQFRPDQAVRAIHRFRAHGPGGGTWTHDADCARGRWYPSCATLPDGRVLIVGGSVRATHNGLSNTTFEIYDPETRTVTPETVIPDADFSKWSSYPFVFVLPSNRVMIHFGTRTRFLDLVTGQFDSLILEAAQRPNRQGRTYGVQGTAVLLPLFPTSSPPYAPRVMMIGGGGVPAQDTPEAWKDTPATNTCEILDLCSLGPSPELCPEPPNLYWALAAPMKHPRVMPDSVILPDGKVFVCNGSSQGKEGVAKDPVYEAEMYDPAADTWTTLCHASVPRLYHATAVLLPDGRVLTAGTDCAFNPSPYNESQLTVEVFSPPYVFQDRPDIGHPVKFTQHGQEIYVPTKDAKEIASAAIVRHGSATHSFNPDQRYVGLPIIERSAVGVRVAIPSDACLVPAGPYLLFLLSEERIPSVGRHILVGATPPIPTVSLKDQPPERLTTDPWFLTQALRTAIKRVAKRVPVGPPPVDGEPDPVDALFERLAQLEGEMARIAAFVEAQQRPLYGAHGEGSGPTRDVVGPEADREHPEHGGHS